jgi:hypothetical protein
MFDDLDATLAQLLEQELAASVSSQLTISFLPPSADFPPSSVTPPALNLFLYDIRENRELRDGDWELVRDDAGAPTGRRPAPMRIECSYLVTAWPSSSSSDPARDEHRLLGEVVKALARNPVLPATVLQGEMALQEAPLPTTALQPGRLQSIAEFWQVSGARPKAALSCTVTIRVDGAPALAAGPAVTGLKTTVELRD